MISLRNASKTFNDGTPEAVLAVRNVSMSVSLGEFVAVYGRSGSGKTTLLNLVAGLTQMDSGELDVGEWRLHEANQRELERLRSELVGMVFQEHNLLAEFTAQENVGLPLISRGESTGAALKSARATLARLEVGDLYRRFPSEMSGGQRQRVGIARAVTGNKKVLLADEPTGALDTVNSTMIFQLLRSIADQGTAVMVATHDPLAVKFATRVYWMRDGELLNECPDA